MYPDYTSWFTNTYTAGSYCNPVDGYYLYRWSSPHSTNAQIDQTTGEFKVDTSFIHDYDWYDYRVTYLLETDDSTSFRIRTKCCTTSNTITNPTLRTYQEYYIDGNQGYF